MTLLEKEIIQYIDDVWGDRSVPKDDAIKILFEGFKIGANFGNQANDENMVKLEQDIKLFTEKYYNERH